MATSIKIDIFAENLTVDYYFPFRQQSGILSKNLSIEEAILLLCSETFTYYITP
jgi:hypothetical protein